MRPKWRITELTQSGFALLPREDERSLSSYFDSLYILASHGCAEDCLQRLSGLSTVEEGKESERFVLLEVLQCKTPDWRSTLVIPPLRLIENPRLTVKT